jgi:hypothetical protein
VTEVERFFRRLVSTLATTDPTRLQGPLLLDDITGSILPYRAHRRALELDTVEDYEAVLLRLCAGESELVWTEPEEARARFVEECRSANPDLTVLYAFENVQVSVRPEPLLWALAPDPRADYPPPAVEPPADPAGEPAAEPDVLVLGSAQFDAETVPADDLAAAHPAPTAEDALPEDDVPEEPPPTACRHCRGALPTHRTVNFCPHCGRSQAPILCPECRSEVEPGWRHCVSCGARVEA